jgi:hypothetical protein
MGCPNGRYGRCHHHWAEELQLESGQHSPDYERGEHRQTRHYTQPKLVTGQEVAGRVEDAVRCYVRPVPHV